MINKQLNKYYHNIYYELLKERMHIKATNIYIHNTYNHVPFRRVYRMSKLYKALNAQRYKKLKCIAL